MVNDTACSRTRMYPGPVDIIEILTVSDAGIVQRILKQFLRILVNRTHHYTPYRQCFRWCVPLPQTPKWIFILQEIWHEGGDSVALFPFQTKKINNKRQHWKFREPERLSRIPSVSFSSPLSTALLLQLSSMPQSQGTTLECILEHGSRFWDSHQAIGTPHRWWWFSLLQRCTGRGCFVHYNRTWWTWGLR